MTFLEKQMELVDKLTSKGFACETDKTSISFALTSIGLTGVWAEITEEEIKYQVKNP